MIGSKTKHFAQEDWADLARGVKPSKVQAAMQDHLDAGCKKCRKALEMWRQVCELTGRESSYQPQDSTVRSVKGFFAIHKPRKAFAGARIANLIFDSLLSPVSSGVRAMANFPGQTTRCFLYSTGRCFVDLRLEQKDGTGLVFMVGQVLNSSEESSATFQGIPVVLWNGEKALMEKVTNNFGEFEMEYQPSREMVLLVKIPEQEVIGVPLPDLQISPPTTPQKSTSRGTSVL